MLELRMSCENCNKELPNDSDEAMICSYECTFCKACVDTILENVCPNCGGGFEKRPTRPQEEFLKNPGRADRVYKPINLDTFESLKQTNKGIDPRKR